MSKTLASLTFICSNKLSRPPSFLIIHRATSVTKITTCVVSTPALVLLTKKHFFNQLYSKANVLKLSIFIVYHFFNIHIKINYYEPLPWYCAEHYIHLRARCKDIVHRLLCPLNYRNIFLMLFHRMMMEGVILRSKIVRLQAIISDASFEF